jgi:hypothetical protein
MLWQTQVTGATPTTASVKLDGTPRTDLLFQPDGVTATLLTVSQCLWSAGDEPDTRMIAPVLRINPSTLVPDGATSTGILTRRTGYHGRFISRNLAYMPLPNNL